jgi:hypothetical protein
VNDELDALGLGHADLEESGGGIWADEHGELTKIKHSDWVAVGVKHVVV